MLPRAPKMVREGLCPHFTPPGSCSAPDGHEARLLTLDVSLCPARPEAPKAGRLVQCSLVCSTSSTDSCLVSCCVRLKSEAPLAARRGGLGSLPTMRRVNTPGASSVPGAAGHKEAKTTGNQSHLCLES